MNDGFHADALRISKKTTAADVDILGVGFDGEPLDYTTWSGSSRYFFNALKSKGHLAHAISAEPPSYKGFLYKLASFHPNIAKWKFKYHINTRYYDEMTKVAMEKIKAYDNAKFNVILQTGAWYDLTQVKNKLTVSYNDGNFQTLLNSPYGYPRVNERLIRKTLAFEKKIYNKLDRIFTMSKWLADSFVKDFGIQPDKVVSVGAGINLPYIKTIENKSYQANNILFVGKDFERKGGRFLLEAFEKVKSDLPGAMLTIIGSEIANPPAGVKCLGYVSKNTQAGVEVLLEEYAKASVFVMPSLYEPFGIVFAEAMAHKLPCIGTSICAMPEIIDDGVTGYIVPPADSHLLAKSITRILKEPEMAKEMGENAFAKYVKHYTWDTVTAKMVASIQSMF